MQKLLTLKKNSDRSNNLKFAGEYFSAFLLSDSNDECLNDPEARIYLNNANAEADSNFIPIRIAVSVPISRTASTYSSNSPSIEGALDSKETLLGVAIAQEEINATPKADNINPLKLVIGIADDGANDDTGAGKVAKFFVENLDVLGVIGHSTSGATQVANSEYEGGKLVAISPQSTAVRQSKDHKSRFSIGEYIFRTSPTDAVVFSNLIKNLPGSSPKIALLYESGSPYSLSFRDLFIEELKSRQGSVVVECNLTGANCPSGFADQFIAIAEDAGAEALLLVPSSQNSSDERTNKIIGAAKQANLLLLGGDSMYKQRYQENPNAEGMIVAVPWYRKDGAPSEFEDKANDLFAPAQKKVGVSWRSAMSYDATQALAKGLRKASERCNSFISMRRISSLINFSPNKKSVCLRNELKVILSDEKAFSADSVIGENKVRFDGFGDRDVKELVGSQMGGLVRVERKQDGSYGFAPFSFLK
jgi:ABC-type branched-subunit amino acid transport system substrate-binding protein